MIFVRILRGRFAEGAEDLRTAPSLDSMSQTTNATVEYSHHPLMRASCDRLRANDVQGCIELVNLALMLAPGNADARASASRPC